MEKINLEIEICGKRFEIFIEINFVHCSLENLLIRNSVFGPNILGLLDRKFLIKILFTVA